MNQNGSSLTDTLVKLVLIFFISLLSFSVGTFVGKQFADGQRKYAHLESDYDSQRDTASVAPDAAEVKPDEALTDEDIANLTEEFVKSEKEKGKDIMKKDVAEKDEKGGEKKDMKEKGKETTEIAKAEPQKEGERSIKVVGAVHKEKEATKPTTASAVQPSAERVAQGETPTPPHPEKRVPSSLPMTTSTSVAGKFTVQIAAYATEDEAQKRVQALKERGVSAFTVTAQKNGKNWYRVGVGLYENIKDASSARADLAKQTDLKDSFVQKIVQ